MAITSSTFSGQSYTPGQNPKRAIAESDATAQPNFEYIFDISIEGVTFNGGASYLRFKTPADPVYGDGSLDISPIVRSYFSGDIGDTEYGFQQCSNSLKKVTVNFGELYGPSSGVVAYPNQSTSSIFVFNGALDALEFYDFLRTQYVCVNTTINTNVNILTNAPSSGTIQSGQNQWIYVMSQTSGAVKFANINTYTGVGTNKVFGTAYKVINHAYHNTTTTENRMLRFPCGASQLNNIVSSSITPPVNDGITSMINQLVTAWEIYFTNSTHDRITESYWVILDNPCTQHDVYRIHFMNKWGAYDSFNFIRASQISTDVKRSKYQKPFGKFRGSLDYGYNKTDRIETNFYTEYRPTIRLNSDWITESQSTWLEELITSPDIRLEDSSGNLIPVNVLETNHTRRQHKTDKIFNMQINIQYSFVNNRQGG